MTLQLNSYNVISDMTSNSDSCVNLPRGDDTIMEENNDGNINKSRRDSENMSSCQTEKVTINDKDNNDGNVIKSRRDSENMSSCLTVKVTINDKENDGSDNCENITIIRSEINSQTIEDTHKDGSTRSTESNTHTTLSGGTEKRKKKCQYNKNC